MQFNMKFGVWLFPRLVRAARFLEEPSTIASLACNNALPWRGNGSRSWVFINNEWKIADKSTLPTFVIVVGQSAVH